VRRNDISVKKNNLPRKDTEYHRKFKLSIEEAGDCFLSPGGEDRGEGESVIIPTLAPALSRQQERGLMIFFPPLVGFTVEEAVMANSVKNPW
jgi:hypothetical protein